MAAAGGSLRVIIGAGEQRWDGWIATHREQLDLCDRATWAAWFGERLADGLLCEHVFEHLTEAEGRTAAALCFAFLKPGGFLRLAVPDAFYPDPDYQNTVKPGGPGPSDHPAADHKIVYDHRSLSDVLASAGFTVDLLEY
jgi:predicted SAM-dependent methyltransferase